MNFLFIDHNGVCYLYLLLHHPIHFPLIGSAHLEIEQGVVQGIAHRRITMRKWLSFYEKVAWFLLIPTLGTITRTMNLACMLRQFFEFIFGID